MIEIKSIKIGDGQPFALIAGPCVVENEQMIIETAYQIKKITEKLQIPFIFKSSYRKANRTSINSFKGLGDEEAISILKKVKDDLQIPVLTDIHLPEEINKVLDFADVIQIPAFLSRQTELLVAVGESGKVVNVKKGQFLAPNDMEHVIKKIESTGNKKILLTERGTSFGYHNLVVDMRSLVIMQQYGYPVVMDATHSVQLPANSSVSGGEPQFIKPLAKAAAAIGIDALFIEVHPNPKEALSDAQSQLQLEDLENLLIEVKEIDALLKKKQISSKNGREI
jgi:2-dehydro-3-deoxyphosphooctonate aldolase (KDO 8-P synthase)